VRAQVDRDLTTVDYFDRLLGLIKTWGVTTLSVVLAAGVRAPLRCAATSSGAGTRGDGNFAVILAKWRDSLVTLRAGVRRSREKLRFLASVAIFCSRERDSRAGVRCFGAEAVLPAPLARIR
jgi:hypothetical protein